MHQACIFAERPKSKNDSDSYINYILQQLFYIIATIYTVYIHIYPGAKQQI